MSSCVVMTSSRKQNLDQANKNIKTCTYKERYGAQYGHAPFLGNWELAVILSTATFRRMNGRFLAIISKFHNVFKCRKMNFPSIPSLSIEERRFENGPNIEAQCYGTS